MKMLTTNSSDSVLCADLSVLEANLKNTQAELSAMLPIAGEISTCIENVTLAIDSIKRFGLTDQMLFVFNADKALENLVGGIGNLSRKTALEELDSEKKNLLQRFIAWIKEVIAKITNWIAQKWHLMKIKYETDAAEVKRCISLLKTIDDKKFESLLGKVRSKKIDFYGIGKFTMSHFRLEDAIVHAPGELQRIANMIVRPTNEVIENSSEIVAAAKEFYERFFKYEHSEEDWGSINVYADLSRDRTLHEFGMYTKRCELIKRIGKLSLACVHECAKHLKAVGAKLGQKDNTPDQAKIQAVARTASYFMQDVEYTSSSGLSIAVYRNHDGNDKMPAYLTDFVRVLFGNHDTGSGGTFRLFGEDV